MFAAGALAAVGVFGLTVGSDRSLKPAGVRRAEVLPESLLTPVGGAAPRSSLRRLDIVFVSAKCPACRALVESLRPTDTRSCAGRSVVFATDLAWDDLRRLAGDRRAIVERSAKLRAAFGVRATPTLVALAMPQRRVVGIAVGVQDVRAKIRAASAHCGSLRGPA